MTYPAPAVRPQLEGRHANALERILQEYEEVRRTNEPRVIVLSGPSGHGKTRIVQELRTQLLGRDVYTAGNGSVADRERERKHVNVPGRDGDAVVWLAASCAELATGERVGAAFDQLARQVDKRTKKQQSERKALKAVAKTATQAVGVGLVEAGFTLGQELLEVAAEAKDQYENYKAVRDLKGDSHELEMATDEAGGFASIDREKRIGELANTFDLVIQQKKPVVVVLDDAQHVDEASLAALTRVLLPYTDASGRSKAGLRLARDRIRRGDIPGRYRGRPLLLIVTAWDHTLAQESSSLEDWLGDIGALLGSDHLLRLSSPVDFGPLTVEEAARVLAADLDTLDLPSLVERTRAAAQKLAVDGDVNGKIARRAGARLYERARQAGASDRIDFYESWLCDLTPDVDLEMERWFAELGPAESLVCTAGVLGPVFDGESALLATHVVGRTDEELHADLALATRLGFFMPTEVTGAYEVSADCRAIVEQKSSIGRDVRRRHARQVLLHRLSSIADGWLGGDGEAAELYRVVLGSLERLGPVSTDIPLDEQAPWADVIVRLRSGDNLVELPLTNEPDRQHSPIEPIEVIGRCAASEAARQGQQQGRVAHLIRPTLTYFVHHPDQDVLVAHAVTMAVGSRLRHDESARAQIVRICLTRAERDIKFARLAIELANQDEIEGALGVLLPHLPQVLDLLNVAWRKATPVGRLAIVERVRSDLAETVEGARLLLNQRSESDHELAVAGLLMAWHQVGGGHARGVGWARQKTADTLRLLMGHAAWPLVPAEEKPALLTRALEFPDDRRLVRRAVFLAPDGDIRADGWAVLQSAASLQESVVRELAVLARTDSERTDVAALLAKWSPTSTRSAVRLWRSGGEGSPQRIQAVDDLKALANSDISAVLTLMRVAPLLLDAGVLGAWRARTTTDIEAAVAVADRWQDRHLLSLEPFEEQEVISLLKESARVNSDALVALARTCSNAPERELVSGILSGMTVGSQRTALIDLLPKLTPQAVANFMAWPAVKSLMRSPALAGKDRRLLAVFARWVRHYGTISPDELSELQSALGLAAADHEQCAIAFASLARSDRDRSDAVRVLALHLGTALQPVYVAAALLRLGESVPLDLRVDAIEQVLSDAELAPSGALASAFNGYLPEPLRERVEAAVREAADRESSCAIITAELESVTAEHRPSDHLVLRHARTDLHAARWLAQQGPLHRQQLAEMATTAFPPALALLMCRDGDFLAPSCWADEPEVQFLTAVRDNSDAALTILRRWPHHILPLLADLDPADPRVGASARLFSDRDSRTLLFRRALVDDQAGAVLLAAPDLTTDEMRLLDQIALTDPALRQRLSASTAVPVPRAEAMRRLARILGRPMPAKQLTILAVEAHGVLTETERSILGRAAAEEGELPGRVVNAIMYGRISSLTASELSWLLDALAGRNDFDALTVQASRGDRGAAKILRARAASSSLVAAWIAQHTTMKVYGGRATLTAERDSQGVLLALPRNSSRPPGWMLATIRLRVLDDPFFAASLLEHRVKSVRGSAATALLSAAVEDLVAARLLLQAARSAHIDRSLSLKATASLDFDVEIAVQRWVLGSDSDRDRHGWRRSLVEDPDLVVDVLSSGPLPDDILRRISVVKPTRQRFWERLANLLWMREDAAHLVLVGAATLAVADVRSAAKISVSSRPANSHAIGNSAALFLARRAELSQSIVAQLQGAPRDKVVERNIHSNARYQMYRRVRVELAFARNGSPEQRLAAREFLCDEAVGDRSTFRLAYATAVKLDDDAWCSRLESLDAALDLVCLGQVPHKRRAALRTHLQSMAPESCEHAVLALLSDASSDVGAAEYVRSHLESEPALTWSMLSAYGVQMRHLALVRSDWSRWGAAVKALHQEESGGLPAAVVAAGCELLSEAPSGDSLPGWAQDQLLAGENTTCRAAARLLGLNRRSSGVQARPVLESTPPLAAMTDLLKWEWSLRAATKLRSGQRLGIDRDTVQRLAALAPEVPKVAACAGLILRLGSITSSHIAEEAAVMAALDRHQGDPDVDVERYARSLSPGLALVEQWFADPRFTGAVAEAVSARADYTTALQLLQGPAGADLDSRAFGQLFRIACSDSVPVPALIDVLGKRKVVELSEWTAALTKAEDDADLRLLGQLLWKVSPKDVDHIGPSLALRFSEGRRARRLLPLDSSASRKVIDALLADRDAHARWLGADLLLDFRSAQATRLALRHLRGTVVDQIPEASIRLLELEFKLGNTTTVRRAADVLRRHIASDVTLAARPEVIRLARRARRTGVLDPLFAAIVGPPSEQSTHRLAAEVGVERLPPSHPLSLELGRRAKSDLSAATFLAGTFHDEWPTADDDVWEALLAWAEQEEVVARLIAPARARLEPRLADRIEVALRRHGLTHVDAVLVLVASGGAWTEVSAADQALLRDWALRRRGAARALVAMADTPGSRAEAAAAITPYFIGDRSETVMALVRSRLQIPPAQLTAVALEMGDLAPVVLRTIVKWLDRADPKLLDRSIRQGLVLWGSTLSRSLGTGAGRLLPHLVELAGSGEVAAELVRASDSASEAAFVADLWRGRWSEAPVELVSALLDRGLVFDEDAVAEFVGSVLRTGRTDTNTAVIAARMIRVTNLQDRMPEATRSLFATLIANPPDAASVIELACGPKPAALREAIHACIDDPDALRQLWRNLSENPAGDEQQMALAQVAAEDVKVAVALVSLLQGHQAESALRQLTAAAPRSWVALAMLLLSGTADPGVLDAALAHYSSDEAVAWQSWRGYQSTGLQVGSRPTASAAANLLLALCGSPAEELVTGWRWLEALDLDAKVVRRLAARAPNDAHAAIVLGMFARYDLRLVAVARAQLIRHAGMNRRALEVLSLLPGDAIEDEQVRLIAAGWAPDAADWALVRARLATRAGASLDDADVRHLKQLLKEHLERHLAVSVDIDAVSSGSDLELLRACLPFPKITEGMERMVTALAQRDADVLALLMLPDSGTSGYLQHEVIERAAKSHIEFSPATASLFAPYLDPDQTSADLAELVRGALREGPKTAAQWRELSRWTSPEGREDFWRRLATAAAQGGPATVAALNLAVSASERAEAWHLARGAAIADLWVAAAMAAHARSDDAVDEARLRVHAHLEAGHSEVLWAVINSCSLDQLLDVFLNGDPAVTGLLQLLADVGEYDPRFADLYAGSALALDIHHVDPALTCLRELATNSSTAGAAYLKRAAQGNEEQQIRAQAFYRSLPESYQWQLAQDFAPLRAVLPQAHEDTSLEEACGTPAWVARAFLQQRGEGATWPDIKNLTRVRETRAQVYDAWLEPSSSMHLLPELLPRDSVELLELIDHAAHCRVHDERSPAELLLFARLTHRRRGGIFRGVAGDKQSHDLRRWLRMRAGREAYVAVAFAEIAETHLNELEAIGWLQPWIEQGDLAASRVLLARFAQNAPTRVRRRATRMVLADAEVLAEGTVAGDATHHYEALLEIARHGSEESRNRAYPLLAEDPRTPAHVLLLLGPEHYFRAQQSVSSASQAVGLIEQIFAEGVSATLAEKCLMRLDPLATPLAPDHVERLVKLARGTEDGRRRLDTDKLVAVLEEQPEAAAAALVLDPNVWSEGQRARLQAGLPTEPNRSCSNAVLLAMATALGSEATHYRARDILAERASVDLSLLSTCLSLPDLANGRAFIDLGRSTAAQDAEIAVQTLALVVQLGDDDAADHGTTIARLRGLLRDLLAPGASQSGSGSDDVRTVGALLRHIPAASDFVLTNVIDARARDRLMSALRFRGNNDGKAAELYVELARATNRWDRTAETFALRLRRSQALENSSSTGSRASQSGR